jgi:hypothetical protein
LRWTHFGANAAGRTPIFSGALRVISFENPRAPKEVATWAVAESNMGERTSTVGQPASAGRTLHDVQVKDGLAHLAYWRHG